MHNIQKLNGLVVSATTDGFITNIQDLENKLNKLSDEEAFLFKLFSKSGNDLIGLNSEKVNSCLEVKSTVKADGLISWTTRGQFSEDGSIKASTGLQTRKVPVEELTSLFREAMSSENKTIYFIQQTLTSAKDVYLNGNHVVMNYADRRFRMGFDHKRLLLNPQKGEDNKFEGLLDSKPLLYSRIAKDLRNVDKFNRTMVYNKYTTKSTNTKYKNNLELVIRNFVRGWLLFHTDLNLPAYNSYAEIINFVKEHQPEYKISKSSLANLKSRPVGIVFREIDGSNPLIKDFLDYVVKKFPDFDKDKFLLGKWMYKKK
jgi:hypothetical protein